MKESKLWERNLVCRKRSSLLRSISMHLLLVGDQRIPEFCWLFTNSHNFSGNNWRFCLLLADMLIGSYIRIWTCSTVYKLIDECLELNQINSLVTGRERVLARALCCLKPNLLDFLQNRWLARQTMIVNLCVCDKFLHLNEEKNIWNISWLGFCNGQK